MPQVLEIHKRSLPFPNLHERRPTLRLIQIPTRQCQTRQTVQLRKGLDGLEPNDAIVVELGEESFDEGFDGSGSGLTGFLEGSDEGEGFGGGVAAVGFGGGGFVPGSGDFGSGGDWEKGEKKRREERRRKRECEEGRQ